MSQLFEAMYAMAEGDRQRDAVIAANDHTMAKTPSDGPHPEARELTFEEACTGSFSAELGHGPWVWPEPVFVASNDTHNTGIDGLACMAILMRGFASLYEAGYRIIGPPPKAVGE